MSNKFQNVGCKKTIPAAGRWPGHCLSTMHAFSTMGELSTKCILLLS